MSSKPDVVVATGEGAGEEGEGGEAPFQAAASSLVNSFNGCWASLEAAI